MPSTRSTRLDAMFISGGWLLRRYLAHVVRPGQQLFASHEVQYSLCANARQEGGREAELDEVELRRAMRIGAKGDPAAGLRGKTDQVGTQVLPIWIGIDLYGFVQFRGDSEHARPIGRQPEPKVVDASAGMAQNLDIGVPQRADVALGLVLLLPERGMKAAEHEVEPIEGGAGHVAFTLGIQIQLDRLQHAQRR